MLEDLQIREGGKTATVLELLKRPGGATAKELGKATGWQPHSVRGFLSGTLRKKMGLEVISAKGEKWGAHLLRQSLSHRSSVPFAPPESKPAALLVLEEAKSEDRTEYTIAMSEEQPAGNLMRRTVIATAATLRRRKCPESQAAVLPLQPSGSFGLPFCVAGS